METQRKVTFSYFLAIISIMTYLLTSLAEPMLPRIAAVTADRLLPLSDLCRAEFTQVHPRSLLSHVNP